MTEANKKLAQSIKIQTDNEIIRILSMGDKETLLAIVKEKIEGGQTPSVIMDTVLRSALENVGDAFEKRKIFLPHLLLASDTAQTAFKYLEELMVDQERETKGNILLATVQGDVHDIGKNLVKVFMKNAGFEVLDLGKDVEDEEIINTISKQNIDIVGLSALMTTTAAHIEVVIELLKEAQFKGDVIIGGACITKSFADSLGVYYGKTAQDGVKVVADLLNKRRLG